MWAVIRMNSYAFPCEVVGIRASLPEAKQLARSDMPKGEWRESTTNEPGIGSEDEPVWQIFGPRGESMNSRVVVRVRDGAA